MSVRTVCQLLLRLYPAEYQRLFTGEILDVVQQASEERRGIAFTLKEMAGLILGAGVEWGIKLRRGKQYLSDQRDAEGESLDEVTATGRRIQLHIRRMEHAIANHDFPNARFYAREEEKDREKLNRLAAG
jgi:hypothetical protein